MKLRLANELTKHWSPERLARIEARIGSTLACLDRQERERTAKARPSQADTRKARRRSLERAH
ncbi:MAG: hypothetical protein OXC19_08370 [Bryobacterales bacterium]|nr:hypothetical protein [Bryobacterales bacterium]